MRRMRSDGEVVTTPLIGGLPMSRLGLANRFIDSIFESDLLWLLVPFQASNGDLTA